MQNVVTLREARSAVAQFERTYTLSTKEMLMCAEDDPRLAQIDGFELMDWHYALEQINALGIVEDNVIDTFHASAHCQSFSYAYSASFELVNSSEPELLLVA
jgi:hypothetical protein